MQEVVSRINEQHPGYNIYLNKDGKIVAEQIYLSGTSPIGVFDTVDDLMEAFNSKMPCE